MLNKNWLMLLTSFICLASTNAYADNGMPATETLRAMGLSSLQVLSDRDALKIRGMGYRVAKVKGRSSATGGTSDNYKFKDNNFTKGESSASTPKIKKVRKNRRRKTVKIKTIRSGGSSWSAAG